MYGKIFESIYDGTLAGHWQAIVTMQQLIVLATPDGFVDMTPEAIARRTTIPLEIIVAGLDHLAKPDPYTRTPGEDGKRIVLMDDHRPWGWKLVNHAKYRAMRNLEQKREADRARLAEKRRNNRDVATASRGVADVAHSDADSDSDAGKATVELTLDCGQPVTRKESRRVQRRQQAAEVVGYLNEQTGKRFDVSKKDTLKCVIAKLSEGETVAICKAVIDRKVRDWKGKRDMAEYLRPSTLFGPKFEEYKAASIGAARAVSFAEEDYTVGIPSAAEVR